MLPGRLIARVNQTLCMIIDFRELDSGSQFHADVCVVGAGAAGITLALELARLGVDVCLLESGGLAFAPEIQALAGGEAVGVPYFPLEISRLRYLGGSTNHWGGWCTPLNEIDFEQRRWVPDSGWPLGRHELLSYYQRAQRWCQLGPFRYRAEEWEDEVRAFPDLDPNKVESRCWQFSPPTRFGEAYREDLQASERIRVLLHGHVTALEATDDRNAVSAVRINTLEGRSATVRARCFVAACGGIENARLLLLSGWPEGPALGNDNDLVGRYFMEHPHVMAGAIVAADPRALARTFTVFDRDGIHVVAGLCPSAAAQRRERSLNCAATLVFDSDGSERGYESYRELMRNARSGRFPDRFAERIWSVMRDLGDVFEGISRPEGEPYIGAIGHMGFYLRSEQSPNPNSRVTLGSKRDPFDLPLAKLDWRMTSDDKRAQAVTLRLIGEELGRLGLGRLQIPDWLLAEDGGWPDELSGGYHHMGTTRMAERPANGVVNADCRVHGVDNLYVAGSSVFPTGGYANPTLTIVALTVRLAEHLHARLLSRRS